MPEQLKKSCSGFLCGSVQLKKIITFYLLGVTQYLTWINVFIYESVNLDEAGMVGGHSCFLILWACHTRIKKNALGCYKTKDLQSKYFHR